MAEQRMKAREKTVQKMTKDGLVEENLADKSTVRVSSRTRDVQMSKKDTGKGMDLSNRRGTREDSTDPVRHSVQNSRDAPAKAQAVDKAKSRKMIREQAEGSAGSKLSLEEKKNGSGKLQEKHTDLAQSRGDARKKQTGGSKKPGQKQRLKFAYEETAEAVKDGDSSAKLNRMDADGVNFRHDAQKKRNQKMAHTEEEKKNAPKKHSMKEKVYQENAENAGAKKKSRMKFEGESPKDTSLVKKAGTAAAVSVHRQVRKNDDGNAAVEGANSLAEGSEGLYHLEQRSARRRNRRKSRSSAYQAKKTAQAAAESSINQERSYLKKLIQKQRIKKEYSKAKQSEQAMGTAAVGTIDYIKKIGGKVTNFFKEHRKVYISIAALIGMMFLIMTSVTSCSSAFMQSLINYTGTSYISSDEAIRQADLYYTQLEANLQERINQMESEEPGHDEYRYNIGPIEHDPFVLISYLSAKYEEFTFEQVKPDWTGCLHYSTSWRQSCE